MRYQTALHSERDAALPSVFGLEAQPGKTGGTTKAQAIAEEPPCLEPVVRADTGDAMMGRNDLKTDMLDQQTIDPDDVLDVEQLALKTGITGDQALQLVERIGSDRQALEAAARSMSKTGLV
jgi:hypothetical protein